MQTQLVLTINAEDQTGVVQKLADAVAAAGGNWLESSLSQLAGKFAGIVLVSVATDSREEFENALSTLADNDIHVRICDNPVHPEDESGDLLMLKVVANDRPGIVQELTQQLAHLHINVESFDTTRISAAMSSEALFEATALVSLPEGVSEEQVETQLETLSDDLMVEMEPLTSALEADE